MQHRGWLTARQLHAVQDLLETMQQEGKFLAPKLSLDAVADEILRLAPTLTDQTGCRTLDLMHLAAVKLLGQPEFISTNKRQLQAAKLAGFQTHDPTES